MKKFGYALLIMLGVLSSACQKAGPAAAPVAPTPPPAAPQAAVESKPSSPVLARVNGEEITDDQVYERVKARMSKLESQIFDIKRSGLTDFIEEKLIEAEAKKRNVSTTDLLKVEVNDKIPQPSEVEIKAFYEGVKDRFRDETIDKLRPRIVAQLQSDRRSQVYDEFIKGLKQASKVEVLMQRPRTEVAATGPSKGKAGAPITIVEFSEYQCPFCKRARPTVQKILETYKDKVFYVFRDFPLSFHQFANKASEAAHCAGEQNKYWEYSDVLWENQRALEVDNLKAYAKKLSLKEADFNACLDSGKFAEQINQDIKAASEAGVSGTPAYFINGVFISGAQPFENFAEIIDEELQMKGL